MPAALDRARTLLLLVSLSLAPLGCSSGSGGLSPDPTPRTHRLGFTDFPSDFTLEAVADAQRILRDDGDLVVFHLDGGVPWQEEADGTPYDPAYEQQLSAQDAFAPPGHARYVAVTPISFGRDGLALHRGANANEPLTPPWNTLAFDDTLVIRAFRRHCHRMIERFDPQYFAYAIEANLVARKSPAQWSAFLTLAESVYVDLKRSYPALPVFATIQAENLYEDLPANGPATLQLLAFCDIVAVSVYPYVIHDEPSQVPANWLTGIAALAPGKPFAVSETGWPAETVTAPYPIDRPGSPAAQEAWVRRLNADLDATHGVFATWFLGRDYDSLWVHGISSTPAAPLTRLWRDIGLYDGGGQPRPALSAWKSVVSRPLR